MIFNQNKLICLNYFMKLIIINIIKFKMKKTLKKEMKIILTIKINIYQIVNNNSKQKLIFVA